MCREMYILRRLLSDIYCFYWGFSYGVDLLLGKLAKSINKLVVLIVVSSIWVGLHW